MTQQQGQIEEIVVAEQAPGAVAPGLGLGDIIKYGPVLSKLISLLTSGEGEFDVKIGSIRKHVSVTNI